MAKKKKTYGELMQLFSGEALGRVLGSNRMTVSYHRRGVMKPGTEHLARLCAAFGKEFDLVGTLKEIYPQCWDVEYIIPELPKPPKEFDATGLDFSDLDDGDVGDLD
jgi:hypothetical protein